MILLIVKETLCNFQSIKIIQICIIRVFVPTKLFTGRLIYEKISGLRKNKYRPGRVFLSVVPQFVFAMTQLYKS